MQLAEVRSILAEVLAPLSVDRFFDEIMGRSFAEVPGGAQHPRRAIFGDHPAETVLAAHATHADRLGCHAEAPRGPAPGAIPAADPQAFRASIEAFHGVGYTVRVPDVIPLAPGLQRFARALEFMLHQPVECSLFWSAEAARAPVQCDDKDIIVIQLVGRKQWYVSAAPPSLHNSWRDIAEVPPQLGEHRTIDMGPGDLIYVPRGTPHTVQSQSESLHLSIGFLPVTLREAIIAALDHLSDFDRPLRETALGRIDRPLDMAALSQAVGDGLERLSRHVRTPGFLEGAMQRRSSRVIGQLARLEGAPPVEPLTAASEVRHNPLALCHMLATPQQIDFCQPGGHINIHRGVEPALRFIAATPVFRIGDIPGGLPDDIRIALVARLMTSGFLQSAGHG
ncbi:MAG: JmjC domain-containing protein [Sphingomonas oligoaromativorans]